MVVKGGGGEMFASREMRQIFSDRPIINWLVALDARGARTNDRVR